MAFYENQDEQQQDPNAPTAQQTSAGSGIISGQGASPGQGSPAANTPDNPGNFVGIQQYLEANKPQSSKLGDQVAGQVQSTIQGANEDVGALQGKFEALANQGQIEGIGTAGQEASDIANRAATGQAGSITEEDKNRFGQVANAQYQGPKSLIETDLYQPTYAKLQDAQNYADLSKNEAGSQQLLKDIYKTPQYSSGENRLDAYLLNSQENRAKLSEARKDAKDLESEFAAANQGAADYAAQQKALADQARQTARSTVAQTQAERNAQIQSELDAISKDWRSEYDKYLNLLKNSNGGQNLQLTDEQARTLGVERGQKIYNLLNPTSGNTPEQYLSMQEFDPNRVISKDQQAQLAALDELAGTFGGALQNKYTQAELAGTLDKAAAFAADKFGLAAKERQQVFDAVDKIRNFTTEATAGANIWDKTPIYKTVRQVREQIVKNMPWPLSDIVEWATRWVEDVSGGVDIQVGHVDANAQTQGTLGSYLQGGKGAAQTETGGTKSLDLGTFMSPDYLISDRADNEIDRLQQQLTAQNQANWANQIENYLKEIGYYNQVK